MRNLTILVIAGYKIFPINSGGAHGQLTFLDKQQHQHNIDLLITPDNIDEADLDAFRQRFPKLNLIQSGYKKISVPAKIMRFCKKQIRKLSLKDLAYQLSKSARLNGFIINDAEHIAKVNEYSAKKNYDIIQIEHVRNMGLICAIESNAKKIFIHHEILHTRVKEDMKSLGYDEVFANYITSVATATELFWLARYDGIVTFNVEDSNILQSNGITVKQQVAQPFALFDEELKHIYSPTFPQSLTFVGGETHYPNKEGLLWFLEKIFPIIKKDFNEVEIKITGHWSKEFMAKYAGDQIIFTGFVDDIDEVLKTSILIVPIRIGSGIRVKVFTAFAKGLPIVSTVLGASGIDGLVDGENILLADDATLFAAHCTRLLQDEALRSNISACSYSLAKKNFGEGIFVQERNEFYMELLSEN